MQNKIAKETVEGLVAGDLVAGKYRVTRILGQGGMGIVAEAIHEALGHRVAIKVLRAHGEAQAEATARFLFEAKAAAQMKSAHVARVTDVSTLDDGSPFFVMEYLEGHDLDTAISGEGVLPVETAVDYVLQACEALAEAHSAGIVHRDLKPANLFLTQTSDGATLVKLLDFGISKYTPKGAEAELSMTKTRALMGSPLYMAPEQMRSTRRVDQRADIWSVGIVLHECLTGQMPFIGGTLPEVCVAIASDDPVRVRAQRPDVPAGLEAVILRCLEKAAEKRFANVAELALALEPFGPPEAAISVKRITRIVHGLGTSMTLMPPTPGPPAVSRISRPSVVPFVLPSRTDGTETEKSSPRPSGPSVNTFAETIGITEAPRPAWRRHAIRGGAILALVIVPVLALRAVTRRSVSSAAQSHEASSVVTQSPSKAAPDVVVDPSLAKPPPTAVAESEAESASASAEASAPRSVQHQPVKQPLALRPLAAKPAPAVGALPSAAGSAASNSPEPSGTAAFGGSRE